MRNVLMALTVAVSAIAPAAVAQTVADKADARCILVLSLAASRDPKAKEAASQGTFFYVGRLNAHAQSARLGVLLVGEMKTMTTQQAIQAELTRCGTELNARGGELGKALTQVQQASQAAAQAAPRPK